MSKRKINVVISGIHYPLTMMLWFIRAFQRRKNVNLWTCGAYTGTWIPWNYGMHVNSPYLHTPNLILPSTSNIIPYDVVKHHVPFEPDLWLQIDAGYHFATKPSAKVVALLETDPHVLKGWYKHPKSYSDVVFCMQTPYIETGEYYLPYAYDPLVHYPINDMPKEYDGCLIGLHYDNRTALINRLRSLKYNIFYDIGKIFDDYREINNKSKIGLNWSNALDMNARVWELAAMGICALENTVPDMPSFFVAGEHYMDFKNQDDAVKKFIMLASDDAMRQEISNAALRKVKHHTYDVRAKQILETCKLI